MYGIKDIQTLTVCRKEIDGNRHIIFYIEIWFKNNVESAWADLDNNLKIKDDKIEFYIYSCGYYSGRVHVKFKNKKQINFQLEIIPIDGWESFSVKVNDISNEK